MSVPVRALHLSAGNLYGGVERIVAECARSRAACPALAPRFAVCFDGRLADEIDASGARCDRMGRVRVSRPHTLWRARRRLARCLAADPPDAVICHSSWMFALAAPVVRRTHAQLVLWLHDRVTGRTWIERWARRHRPDLVISNSRFTAGSLPRLFTDVDGVVLYAPVAAGPDIGSAARGVLRRSLGAGTDDVVVVVASRFEEWKGHRALLRALGRVDGPWRLWIAGAAQRPREDAFVADLRATAAAAGLADRVAFLGERRDVPALFRAADVHCQPNAAPEPFGLAFVEALYAGLPVVTTEMGGARETVTGDCGRLVPPSDDDALAGALQALVRDAALRRRLGDAGPARARALCDPADQLARLTSLLRSAAAEASA
jgi:glycosyltransferase involved in cell wall biosynthesis